MQFEPAEKRPSGDSSASGGAAAAGNSSETISAAESESGAALDESDCMSDDEFEKLCGTAVPTPPEVEKEPALESLLADDDDDAYKAVDGDGSSLGGGRRRSRDEKRSPATERPVAEGGIRRPSLVPRIASHWRASVAQAPRLLRERHLGTRKQQTIIPKGNQTVSGEYDIVENGPGRAIVGLFNEGSCLVEQPNLIGKQLCSPILQGTNASAAALAVPHSKDTQAEPRRGPPHPGRSSLDRQRLVAYLVQHGREVKSNEGHCWNRQLTLPLPPLLSIGRSTIERELPSKKTGSSAVSTQRRHRKDGVQSSESAREREET